MILTENEKLLLHAQRASEAADVLQMLTAADELLRRDPNDVDAMFIAGTAAYRGGQEGIAVILLNAARCATTDAHKLGAIWCNIGCALQEYQPAEAYAAFRRSLTYGTPPPAIYDNLCAACSKMGRHAEALEWADKSAAIDTSHNKSFALMHLGRWGEAWKLYARSAGTPTRPKTERNYDLPRWDGKSPGKVIIHGEQGIGDEIMFLSMLPRDFDGVIETSPRIGDLVARSFKHASVYGTLLQTHLEWPYAEKADWHLEMGGIGEFFASEPVVNGGFLLPDAARCAAWQAWFAAMDARPVRVGIAWTGGTWATGRAKRSVDFGLVKGLVESHPNVTFVNLEYEDRKEELAEIETANVLNPDWATRKGADYDETASLVASLDLVISVTTSTVDLAGALGVPCWALVDESPQWRYSDMAGPDSMWFYDSVRCFRQKPADNGKWGRVLDLVSKALKDRNKLEVAA